MTTRELDAVAEKFIRRSGALPSLKGFKGFPGCICVSVNNVAAHGVPSDYTLTDGDVVSVDISVSIDGWFGDSAWSYIVGDGGPDSRRVIRAAWQATVSGVRAARAGARLGDIGHAIKAAARQHGCSVFEDYVGHGIGQNMHEEPMVPNFGDPGSGQDIVPGMVFTVEPIVTLGGQGMNRLEDGWTLVTADNRLSAQFEHTVAVFRDYTEVLSFGLGRMDEYLDYPPCCW